MKVVGKNTRQTRHQFRQRGGGIERYRSTYDRHGVEEASKERTGDVEEVSFRYGERTCKKKAQQRKQVCSMSVSFVSSNRCSVDTRNCFRTGLFGVKGQTFFRDLLELEESLRNSIDNASDSQSAIVDERIAKRQDHAEQDGNRSKNDVQNDVTLVDRARDSINSMATSTCKIHSNIQLERKVNAPCLRDAVAERSIGPRKYVVRRII